MDDAPAVHMIMLPSEHSHAVRQKIEDQLGVRTSALIAQNTCMIYFNAPTNVDLDFLRPDVLPPR